MTEMNEVIMNKWNLKSENLDIQRKFQSMVKKQLNFRKDLQKLHGFIHPNSIISSKFLKQHKYWFN